MPISFSEDVSANMNALEILHGKFNTQLLLIESGGDNLAANYSRELGMYMSDTNDNNTG